MSKRIKIYIGIMTIATVLLLGQGIYRFCNTNNLRTQMNISEDSIVETYQLEESIFVKVINEYIMAEELYFVTTKFPFWKAELLQDAETGISDIVDVVFQEWKGENLVEIACSTNKGNGYVSLYWLQKDKLTLLLTDKNAVDRNLDTATNTVYEDGRLFLHLRESKNQTFYPDVFLEGIECVYGYDNSNDYSGEELLYQRNSICHVFCWDEDSGEYILVEDSREVLQQVEGVYSVWE